MTNHEKDYALFLQLAKEIAYLKSAEGIVGWDMETKMPPAGAEHRSKTAGALATLVHQKSVSPELGLCLVRLKNAVERGNMTGLKAKNVTRAFDEFERKRKLPEKLVSELAEVTSSAHHIWSEAEKNSDFKSFEPSLTRIVALLREKGRILNGTKPYDALIADYSPGATAASLEALLNPLRDSLKPILERIAASPHQPDRQKARFAVPVAVQKRACRNIAKVIGFDFKSGRLDASAHPFSNRMHPGDYRITTTYEPDNFLAAVYGVIHEAGHSFYDRGLPVKHFGTAAGETVSYGLHESQSRTWEAMVGHSRAFCRFLACRLKDVIDIPDVEEFYRSVNIVEPPFIRLDADEVTYNLHICLRFELERDLIEGKYEAAVAPDAWNAKMKEFLGLTVEKDSDGVLQDVHWSAALFGYFPSYAEGNLYAAQLFEAAERDIAYLDREIERGNLADLKTWLAEKVWRHGSLLDAAEIIEKATGKPPGADAFIKYVNRKYGEIYKL